jgi:hypothetical protein
MAGFVDVVKYRLVILMFLLFIYTSYFMGGSYLVPLTTSYYMFPEVKANAPNPVKYMSMVYNNSDVSISRVL